MEASLNPIIYAVKIPHWNNSATHACTTRKTEEGPTIFGPAIRSSQSLGYIHTWLGLYDVSEGMTESAEKGAHL